MSQEIKISNDERIEKAFKWFQQIVTGKGIPEKINLHYDKNHKSHYDEIHRLFKEKLRTEGYENIKVLKSEKQPFDYEPYNLGVNIGWTLDRKYGAIGAAVVILGKRFERKKYGEI